MARRFRHPTAVVSLLLAAAALGAAVVHLPKSLRQTQRQVDTNAGLTRVERELAPTRAYAIHADLALRAADVIPRNGVFYVATGGQSGSGGGPPFYAYWLLPRRHTDDVHAAGWIVSWGADPARLGVKTKVVADLGGGAEVLRVER